MEIYYDKGKSFISVWMTNEEQKLYDRKKLTAQLLKDVDDPKCRVIFCLSGKGDLFEICLQIWQTHNKKQRSTPTG